MQCVEAEPRPLGELCPEAEEPGAAQLNQLVSSAQLQAPTVPSVHKGLCRSPWALHGPSSAWRKYPAPVHVTVSAMELEIASAGGDGEFGIFPLTWFCLARIM